MFKIGIRTGVSRDLNLLASRRYQSSFTFLNNQSLLQKDQVKQQKRKNKKQQEITKTEEPESRPSKKRTQVELSGKKRHDYSWLPKAPSTEHLKLREISTDVFYSGYRPIFLNPASPKESESTLYEFAMKLEALGDPIPWVSSATGTEFYGEWDNVPTEVIKKLKPFQPPVDEMEKKDIDALKQVKQEFFAKEKNKLLNREKGRKRPIIRLLQLKKKLNE